MNKKALLIPRPGATSKMSQMGYADALKHLGWTVYLCDPKSKLGCRRMIEDLGIGLIMTHSRYGIRQLPVSVINDNDVAVVVEALPLNPTNKTIDGPYEFAHDDEPSIIEKIRDLVVHTRFETNIWPEYMVGWNGYDIDLLHLPAAGNLVKAIPPTCSLLTDVAMVANFTHRQRVMKQLIAPLFKRLDLLGYSYQAFGDNVWEMAGVNHNGPLPLDGTKLSHIYATSKVCPNIHTERQIDLQACVNERTFLIPLCGGIQVTDNPLTSIYLGSHCEIATGKTDFMNKVIGCIEDQSKRFDKIRAGSEEVANNHTYFNRLADIFRVMEMTGLAYETEIKRKRAAVRHCWELNARLSSEERGVPYVQKVEIA